MGSGIWQSQIQILILYVPIPYSWADYLSFLWLALLWSIYLS